MPVSNEMLMVRHEMHKVYEVRMLKALEIKNWRNLFKFGKCWVMGTCSQHIGSYLGSSICSPIWETPA